MKSSAYQLSSRFPGEWKDRYINYYPRQYVRVMTGPEVIDAVADGDRRADAVHADGRARAARQAAHRADRTSAARGEGPGGRFADAELLPEQPADAAAGRQQALDAAGAADDAVDRRQRSRADRRRAAASAELVARRATPTRSIDELYLATLARAPRPDGSRARRVAAVEADRAARHREPAVGAAQHARSFW